ncbi:hypothetical protein IWW36_005512 [Coemansia brasiliensis]|uniref:Uncharacterized protein n=1 Tax=Coemansia brasiliensis TaxID=2650707 RepID=A0A9W8I3K0_9FUNG|nr:hypothetical protein IWW36_005512 [Coemansia brasiliensis]
MQQLTRLRAARAREAQMNYKRKTNPHALLLKTLRESSWSPQLHQEKSGDLKLLNRNMVFFDARVSSDRYADVVKNIESQLSKLEYSKWASLPIMVVEKWKDAVKNGASKFPGFVIIPQDFNTQVALGQTEAPNAANMMAPTPANVVESTPVAYEQQQQQQQQPMEMDTMSLLNRLVSFFDFSQVGNTFTTAPVVMAPMYNPDTSKFTILSASVMKQGDSYFMPVCPVSAIANAGAEIPAVAISNGCTMGVQLTPMPMNAASSLYSVLKAKLRIIASLAGPSGWRMAFGMMRNMMPGSYAMAQGQPQTAAM